MTWPGRSLLRVPQVRHVVARLRHAFLSRTHKLVSLAEHGSSAATLAHNKRSLLGFNPRNEQLLFATLLAEDLSSARILVIGCRSEEEILMFQGYGLDRITAIDLMSYSPWIQTADMHMLPFEDGSFDAVFCAYTLSYSNDPGLAAREMLRVLADGGIVSIAVEYMPHELRATTQERLLGYRLGSDVRLDSTAAIRDLFQPHVRKVFVDYDAEKRRHHTPEGLVDCPSPVMTVFTIGKN